MTSGATDEGRVSLSRRGVALGAALTLLTAVPAAEAKPAHHQRSHTVRAPKADWDRDGLNNRYERKAGTRPRKADSDADGVADGLEDRDRVNNHTEQLARTNPRRRDSNRNHLADGREDPDSDGLDNHGESLTAMHPRNADTDGDGVSDGDEHAGVISSLTPTATTIALAAGGALTAAVNENTDVLCGADGGSFTDDPGADPAGEDDPSADDGGGMDPSDPGAGDDGGDDLADSGDDTADQRSARLPVAGAASGGCPAVGDVVYEADVEDTGSGLLFTVLDLLGA